MLRFIHMETTFHVNAIIPLFHQLWASELLLTHVKLTTHKSAVRSQYNCRLWIFAWARPLNNYIILKNFLKKSLDLIFFIKKWA